MTAEMAILNREGVALAADSADTLLGPEGPKIYSSAKKIQQLSSSRPVGVMVYGSAAVCGVPWESIISAYRAHLGDSGFDTVDEYAQKFFEFLDSKKALFFPEDLQAAHFENDAAAWLDAAVVEAVRSTVEEQLATNGKSADVEVDAIVRDVVAAQSAAVAAWGPAPGLPARFVRDLEDRYGKAIDESVSAGMGALAVDEPTKKLLHELIVNLFTKEVPEGVDPPSLSGIVIAGFGEAEMFPHLRAYHVYGVVANRVLCRLENSADIGVTASGSAIVPFAQRDTIDLFMEGVDREYDDAVMSTIENLLPGFVDLVSKNVPGLSSEQRDLLRSRSVDSAATVMDAVRALLADVRDVRFSEPVKSLVNGLPARELATVAAALVRLQSDRRRVSWDAETVGGPIDVALISRAEGFIWVQRKP